MPPESLNPGDIKARKVILAITGNDVGSGIVSYAIYGAQEAHSYSLWGTTTNGTAIFDCPPGHRYYFYSVATDGVGNVQSVSGNADVDILAVNDVHIQVKRQENTFQLSWPAGIPNIQLEASDKVGGPYQQFQPTVRLVDGMSVVDSPIDLNQRFFRLRF